MKQSPTDDHGAVWRFPNLSKLRQDAGLTITALANQAGVGRDLIGNLERGKAHTRVKVMLVFNALNRHEFYNGRLQNEQEVVRAGRRK